MKIDYSKLPRRDIFCIDVKSFFASVEAVRRKIHPLDAYIIVVSNTVSKGAVVLASSPKVKKEFNIKTGSRRFEIPDDKKLMIVEPSMGLYLRVNAMLLDIFRRYVSEDDLLIYSIDEAFLDISSVTEIFGEPHDIAKMIKDEVWNRLKLVVAVGIGDNPLLAKLALDNDAKYSASQIAYWSYERVPYTVWKIKTLKDMWGISYGYEKRLNNLGIRSVYDLAHSDPNVLKSSLGIIGLQLFYHSHGVDYSIIREKTPTMRKSYSKGQILLSDYTDKDEILFIIREMTEEVAARLRSHDMLCQNISLFVGFGRPKSESDIFENKRNGFSKSHKLSRASNSTSELFENFCHLFLSNWMDEPVRQINISCNDLIISSHVQLNLFSMQQDIRQKKIDLVIDNIRNKYGKTSVFRAYNLMHGSTFLQRSGFVGGHKGETDVKADQLDEKTKDGNSRL